MAWEDASHKHVREYDDLLRQAAERSELVDHELEHLRPLLNQEPAIVHLQSGHGLDDIALAAHGARRVIGVDYSEIAATAAQRRANELEAPCRYVVSEVPGTPLADACAELVYTGKGAIIWQRDLTAWTREIERLLRPGGHLFVYDAHPAVPLWTWDADEPRIRADRSYFARSHLNDSYPARGARERQWTLGEIVTAIRAADLDLLTLAEHPEPFWRPDGTDAAAWHGRLPNSFALLAGKPQLRRAT
jgi:SAM-dependent methyltransferase